MVPVYVLPLKYGLSGAVCEPLDIEVKKPRICGRQIMRDNVEAESGRLL
jgi:hypothetical protein